MTDQTEIAGNFIQANKSARLLVTLNDSVIICPLDASHRIRYSEIQCHLERCLIGDLMERTCPNNPLHILDEASYDHHVEHCKDALETEADRHDEN